MPLYYDHNGITIYHGDCREILSYIRGWDLMLTDPPYGIDYDTSHIKYKNGIARDKITGDLEPFDPSHLIKCKGNKIIWGGNCFSSRLPDSKSWLAWIKTARDNAAIRQSDMELAWTNCVGRSRVYHHLWIGAFRASEAGQRSEHANQKPIRLMQWCITLVPGTICVIDPYMGSGTTLRAAKNLGLRAIGIEIEEKYCEIAARRLSQEVMGL